MLDTDPHALLAAIDRVTEEEKPLVDVLSAPLVPSNLVLDEPDQALGARGRAGRAAQQLRLVRHEDRRREGVLDARYQARLVG